MGDLSIYDPVFKEAGLEWNVDPTLLKAVAAQESGGKSQAVSKAGAAGLMGIMPDTGRGLGMTDLKDPVQSIWGGAKYLASALDAEGTPQKALLYYHGGPDWRQRFGPESAAYVPSVAKHYQQFAGLGVPTAGGAGPAAADGAPGGATPPAATEGAGKVESDADFLKRTTSGQAKPAGESDADFLKRTTQGAKSETPPAAEPTPAPTLDEYGRAAPDIKLPPSSIAPGTAAAAVAQGPNAASVPTQGPPTPAADVITGVLGRVGQAAVQGFQGTPNLLTPEAQASLEAQGPVGRYISGPLIKIGNQVLGAAGAVGGAAGQALYEAGNALGGPTLGRDFYMGGQVAPVAGMGAGVPNMLEPPASIAPRFVQERFGEPPPGRLPQLLGAIDRADQQPIRQPGNLLDQSALIQPPPRPMVGEGATQSVGAAASREGTPPGQIQMTPSEMKANRRQGEMAEINAPAQPGDTKIYVEGSLPTLAQRSGNPTISQQESLLMQRAPDAFGARLGDQNAARIKAFENAAPSDTRIDTLTRERAALAANDSKAVLEKSKPADLQPAVAHIDAILNDPRIRENPDVVKTMGALRDSLFNADGTLKTDPQAVWGIHDRLINLMAKAKDPLNATGAEKFAFKQLEDFKPIIDGVMNTATDGHFQTFLDHYADLSKQINAGTLLNKFRQLALTNNKGEIQGNRFHKFVTDLAYSRGKPGIDPAMDIPDETMQTLINIDNDLKRAGQIDLGKARGSPTNLFGVLAGDMGLGAAHLGIAAISGGNPTGNLLLQGGVNAVKGLAARARLNSLTRKHLGPPQGGYQQPENYLQPPP